MAAPPPQVTLDANLIHEYLKQRPKRAVVEALIARTQRGALDLAVTARIHEDIPREPLAGKLNGLPALGINETGSVSRLPYWIVGRDYLGTAEFEAFHAEASDLARQRRKRPPDWRDWDHLHAHWLQKRDVFLTWDEGILCLEPELRDRFGIRVMRPEDYLASLIPPGT
jgi:hypothetical protein